MSNKEDPYQLHRAALTPLLPGASESGLEKTGETISQLGEAAFAEFLLQQGLAPLWDQLLENRPDQLRLSTEFRKALHNSRLHATGLYLIQRNSLEKIKQVLNCAEVPHVVTKGAHTREIVYDSPALRPAEDIDILVKPQDNITAIRAFQEEGFTFHGAIENIAQDCSLIKGKTAIDLHWDILRPGRTRQPMVEALLHNRTDYGSHWGMSHGATLFLMLVHPVFRKYSTTPHAALVRLIDTLKLLDKYPTSVEEARELLQLAGLTTAGWITATWLHMLTGSSKAKALADTLSPGTLKQRYLYNWLSTNRSTRLLDKPAWIHLGFTLPAHDNWADAIRALRQARRCKHEAASTLANIQKQVS